jgi:starvation-inducible DNA-binding protein
LQKVKTGIYYFGGTQMFLSSSNARGDSFAAANGNPATDSGIELLEELLTHTITVRDLYRYARHRSANTRFHHLFPLFETHYKDQLRLVDVLVERMRALGGASRVAASAFVRGIHPSCAQHGRLTQNRLLCDLLDAHEVVLSTLHTSGAHRVPIDRSAARDFAVAAVVLTNEQQVGAVREQLLGLEQNRVLTITSFGGADACE